MLCSLPRNRILQKKCIHHQIIKLWPLNKPLPRETLDTSFTRSEALRYFYLIQAKGGNRRKLPVLKILKQLHTDDINKC